MKGTFRIEGGVPLAGEVTPIPNKNALMGALPAAALAGDGITFAALPDTLDVHTYLEILTRLGARVSGAGDGAVHVDPAGIRAQAIDPDMGRRLRGAFALTGPLLARLGTVEMPLPGGCELGYRAVTAHLDGFRKLGVDGRATRRLRAAHRPAPPRSPLRHLADRGERVRDPGPGPVRGGVRLLGDHPRPGVRAARGGSARPAAAHGGRRGGRRHQPAHHPRPRQVRWPAPSSRPAPTTWTLPAASPRPR